eukprot:CAMPEP_0194346482 /NCGR_PEP_ID=MMETSP0171-20130528/105451_1 /TAXON_ID=218684 /ORGANISM="Corethron pennatum, Strain L29A3" /LENGTH=585 /DNA_ID=CAMNT_0039113613 /DNA_START=243 /DNA_END=2000 /DNA_ORIENTATION=+
MNLLEVAASARQRVAELEDRCGERVPSISPSLSLSFAPTRTNLCATPCTSTALVKLSSPAGTTTSIAVAGDTLITTLLAGSVSVHGRCHIQPDIDGHVEWPADKPEIPEHAFRGCKKLKSINIPPEVQFIHDTAFYRTKINLLEVAASALQRVAELEDLCGERVPTISPYLSISPMRTDLCATPCTSTALVKLSAASIENIAVAGSIAVATPCTSMALVKLPVPPRNSFESIAVAGDTLVVGSPYEYDNSGAAYVFSRQTTGAWVQTQRLIASDGAFKDYFSLDIAFDANTLVIGSKGAGAYVFTLQVGEWTETQKLMAEADGAKGDRFRFGHSVAVYGDTLVVGAYGDDDLGNNSGTSYSGSAYVFSLQSGAWMQSTKLLASDVARYDNYFGLSVAVSPGLVAVGAPGHDQEGADAGAVYMYTPDASGSWTQAQKLQASDGENNARFGWSVAASDGTVVVGVPCYFCSRGGSVSVFSCTAAGVCAEADVSRWDETLEDDFGNSVAISCNKIVVGASFHDDQGQNPGSVYTFSWHQARGWAQTSKIVSTNRAQGDGFGHMVAISSHTVAAVDSLGSAYVKEVCDS